MRNVYHDLHPCQSCRRLPEEHAEGGKCLYGPGSYFPLPLVDMGLEELKRVCTRIDQKRRGIMVEISELNRESKELERYANEVEARKSKVCNHLNPDGSDAIQSDRGLGQWCPLCGWNDY